MSPILLSSPAPPGRDAQAPHAPALDVRLFGQMRVERDGVPVEATSGARPRELLCYLLLNRRRAHSREAVASTLWGDQCTTARSKTYLRKALWQLQSDLHAAVGDDSDLITADAEWIRIGPASALRLDVAALEEAHARLRDVPGERLGEAEATALRVAVDAYTSDLLEGWYQEWCLIERARLQRVYLLLVDKLMAYCAAVGAHETGLAYGERSLQYDRARECTYRQVIRLHAALGDRTGALRAFERCEAALREELAARPGPETVALADGVRNGAVGVGPEARADAADVGERLDHLARLQQQLVEAQARVCDEVAALRRAVRREGDVRGAVRPGTGEPTA